MTTITVFPPERADAGAGYRAVAGERQATGGSVGEAIDALAPQLPADGTTVVVIRARTGDELFGDAERARLADLMAKWRTARDGGGSLPADEQTELDALVWAELRAATARADAIRRAVP